MEAWVGGARDVVEFWEGKTRFKKGEFKLRVFKKMEVEDDVVNLLNSFVENP